MDNLLGTWLGQVGVGGIFLILVLRMVLDFVSKYEQRKAAKNSGGDVAAHRSATTGEHSILERKLVVIIKKIEVIEKQTDDLYKWHAKEDDDGVKVWYVRRSLEEAMMKLAESMDRQTTILAEVAREQRHVVEGQKAVIDQISRLTEDLPRLRAPSQGG